MAIKLKIHTDDAELISKINTNSAGFFYSCKKKNADISYKQNLKRKYFCRRKQKQRDNGLYFAGSTLQLFTIKFGQIYLNEKIPFHLKTSIINRNNKGKVSNI